MPGIPICTAFPLTGLSCQTLMLIGVGELFEHCTTQCYNAFNTVGPGGKSLETFAYHIFQIITVFRTTSAFSNIGLSAFSGEISLIDC